MFQIIGAHFADFAFQSGDCFGVQFGGGAHFNNFSIAARIPRGESA